MKYLVILGDGMADNPVSVLGGKTPLMVADKPYIDKVARMGCSGLLRTIPDGMPVGSAVANLEILGFDSRQYYPGRGVLESYNMGIPLGGQDLVLRLNLVSIENNKMNSHNAGCITTEEAAILIEFLNRELSCNGWCIYTGISYKHILKIENGSKNISCFSPHDYIGADFDSILPRAISEDGIITESLLRDLICKSQKLLENHPINKMRVDQGLLAANCVWPWSPGRVSNIPSFYDLHGVKGAVISAVDLINGIGLASGMEVIKVEGATGFSDTNYEGKARAAISSLKHNDFVFIHIEASDEASHDGDLDLKIRTVEYLDKRIVKTILEEIDRSNLDIAVAILPDHPTSVEMKVHTKDPVPFTIFHPKCIPDKVKCYDEKSVESGSYGLLEGGGFMRALLALDKDEVSF